MANDEDVRAIRSVVTEYLKGMIYGRHEGLRDAMHPLCMQAGHYDGQYEFMPRDEFIEAIKTEKKEPENSALKFDIKMIDITGDIAVVKLTDHCFGTTWTDYLTLIKDSAKWQIIMKAFYNHAID
jgi:hypothetical protein